MSLRPQISPYILTGSTLADLPNPASVPEGYVFRAHTGEALALEINPATGARSWVQFQGTSANQGWPKYVVAPVTGPLAQYTSIQAGIDAAFADGHGLGNPTAVYVLPGVFSQEPNNTITMRAGIDVIGLGGTVLNVGGPQGDVSFIGNIQVDITGQSSIVGMTVQGLLFITGTGGSGVGVINSQFFSSTGPALAYNNTGSSSLYLKNSSFSAIAGANKGADISTTVLLDAEDCLFSGNGTAFSVSMKWNNNNKFVRCTFSGSVVGTGIAAPSSSVEFRDCIYNPGSHEVMSIFSGAVAEISGGKIVGLGTEPMFKAIGGSSATLKMNNLENIAANHISIDTTLLLSSPTYTFRDYNESNIAGTPFTVPQAAMTDVFTVTQTGAWAVVLPALTGIFTGQRVTITNLHATPGALTLTPTGGDTVSGQSPYVTAAAARSVTLQAKSDGGTFDWRIVAISPL